ncbi:CDP-alcohol phosphatidyltransferase family protein [Actinopolymorpha sp. B11F2]|uniref:CDP-alcohol phosphatidyltransferase family protein n=1 Tax=Actinopolymorpha sp. B11F2 TaxID=3160862 RepID=UPI0032E48D6C
MTDNAAPGREDTEIADDRWRDRYPRAAWAARWTTTALAAVLVHVALLLPNQLTHLAPGAFARIPLEGIFGAAVLLALAPRPRRVVAAVAGATLGVLTLLKLLDMGFYSILDRPFDLVLDWLLVANAVEFLGESVGQVGALAAAVGAVLVALVLPVLMALAVVRLSHLMVDHRPVATRTALILGTAWMICVTLGVQIADVSVATKNTSAIVRNRVHDVDAALKDRQAFARQSTVDAFADTPADRLLTGLRGKDVIVAFVESYGRSAVKDPQLASRVRATLTDGTSRLRAAGFSSRSAFLTSPATGAGSWLAHSTFMSGLWIKSEQRYRTVTTRERLTLTGAFRRTDAWRTVGILPGTTRTWPEGKFYEFDRIYDARHLGYEGAPYGWSGIPDQYTLSAFERLERSAPGRKPLMAEIVLTSSHNPWVPLPEMVSWDEAADGSVYDAMRKADKDAEDTRNDADRVRTAYARSIAYSVESLVSYVETYGDDNTVLVFLGDHQPVPTVTRHDPSRDVPISIVARDKKVLDRISGWGWQDGLEPHPDAPVWRMDTFRDKFLTAYGPRPGSTAPGP